MYAYKDNGNDAPTSNVQNILREPLRVTVLVTDPIAHAELIARPEGQARDQFAATALSIGVLCLRESSARVDVESLQAAGRGLIDEAKELISARGNELIQQISSALAEHFDPQTGLLPARIQALVQKDGELEKVLGAYLGADSSVLASSLSAYLSEESPIFKMLSPKEQEGLLSHVNKLLTAALTEQRTIVLKEFSLDSKESALSRFLAEVTSKQGELNQGLQGKIDGVIKEFSLDHPNSALSQLVGRVEKAQRSISDEFSADNNNSAINKLSTMLRNTSEQINQQLTLDNEQSSLSRLKRELQKTLDTIVQSNAQFYVDVRATLAALEARKAEAARSTRHGTAFEEEFGMLLAAEAQRLGDVFEATGTTTGAIRNCKKGDYVLELSSDSAAPGAKIVWEAKEDRTWDLKKAILELEEAKKNREAQVGVFVFSSKTAPAEIESFGRYANNIVLVWDAEDSRSDLLVRLVYTLARALVVREQKACGETEDAVREIEAATRTVEKQIRHLEDVQKWAETVRGNGDKIATRAESMRKDLSQSIERLDEQVQLLRPGGNASREE